MKKRSLLYFLILLLLAGCGFNRGSVSREEGLNSKFGGTYSLEDQEEKPAWPLIWHIGKIDPRFAMADGDLHDAVEGAAKLWEDAAGRQLFVYDPNRGFPIDLVYDERQELVAAEKEGKEQLGVANAAVKEAKARERQAIARFQAARDQVNGEENDYNSAVARHNQEVESYEDGGAPPDVVDRLNSENATMSQAKAQLQGQEQRVEDLRAEANARVDEFNRIVASYNSAVQNFNSKFARGITQQVGACRFIGQRVLGITVYAYTGPQNLQIILAHELGHALGLKHVKGQGAVMSAVEDGEKQTTELALTRRDLAELKRVLEERN